MTRDEMLEHKIGDATLREQSGRLIALGQLADRIFDAFDGTTIRPNIFQLGYRLKRAGEAVDDLRFMADRAIRDIDVSLGLANRSAETAIRDHWIGDAWRKASRATDILHLLRIVTRERDKLAKKVCDRPMTVAAE